MTSENHIYIFDYLETFKHLNELKTILYFLNEKYLWPKKYLLKGQKKLFHFLFQSNYYLIQI